MDFGLSSLWVEGSVQYKVAASSLIIILFLILRKGFKVLIDQKLKNKRSHYHVQRILDYFFWFLKIIFIGRLWFQGLGSLSTFFGLATAGLAVSLKDPLLNLIGWLAIIWKHPFSVGDRIEIKGIKGDVVDINIFEFT